ncbi:hypothetical protein B8A40_06515 [Dolosigranulum pigrum]|uniref:hypothetical protein n=1 Tax=Dolosigranulum pigrum TaxID=29394 RepID=UPI000DC4F3F0|nr:hypothetical protein [Dolosigranulum pigrum]RAN57478.1 hypothetical protein B8A40_06515 [Dolosigranulum pigrum]
MKLQQTYLCDIIKSINIDNVPPLVAIRLQKGLEQLKSGETTSRPIEAPQFLNDLGVRKNTDAKHIADIYLNTVGIDHVKVKDDIVELNINDVGLYLDIYILLTGDYDVISESVTDRISEYPNITDYSGAIYLASYLAALGDDHGIELFDYARKLGEKNSHQVLSALHRKVTYIIKRKTISNDVENILQEYLSTINMVDNLAHKNIYLALFNNLVALYLLKIGLNRSSGVTITTLLDNALLLIDDAVFNSDADNFIKNQGTRYRSQIVINKAQMLVKEEKIGQAIQLLTENVVYVEKHAEEYLPEVIGSLAYAYFLNQDYSQAVSYCYQSIDAYQQLGMIGSVLIMKKVLISSLYKLKLFDKAKHVLETLEELNIE